MDIKNPLFKSEEKHDLTILDTNQYRLECYVFHKNPNTPILYVMDRQTKVYNDFINSFLYFWSIEDIEEDLLPTIDDVIQRGWGDEILRGGLVSAIIEPIETYFTQNHNLGEGKKEAAENDNMHMTTIAFKEVSLKWLEFLKSLVKI